jgi:hypothetical protein
VATAGAEGMRNYRPQIIWLGVAPSEFVKELNQRGLVIKQIDSGVVLEFSNSRALVCNFDSSKPSAVANALDSHGFNAINNGLLIVLLAKDDSEQRQLSALLRNSPLLGTVKRRTAAKAHELAELLARHDAGRGPDSALKTSFSQTEPLNPEKLLLMQRAFNDCTSIHLIRLVGGRSADVYSVHAVFKQSRPGPRPLPFFAKIDRLNKIRRERSNYEGFVEHFIPFNLRPNLSLDRCVEGHEFGIIVGNFVDYSESLWDVLRRGTCLDTINSLFDQTLRGWRLQAYEPTSGNPATQSVLATFGDFIKPEKVSSTMQRLAADQGCNMTAAALLSELGRKGDASLRIGAIHGDLHADNVRVRFTDAILIDFASVQRGPVLCDPASLEVSLAFRQNGISDDDISWKKLIDEIYTKEYFMQAPPPAREQLPREWLWSSIRQIRVLALAVESTELEYLRLVVIYLLRRAMYDSSYEPETPEWHSEMFRRAYGLVIAQRLLSFLP